MSDDVRPLTTGDHTGKGFLYDATKSDELRITIDRLQRVISDKVPSICRCNLWYILFSVFLALGTLAFSLQPDTDLRTVLKILALVLLIVLSVLLFKLKPFNYKKMREDMISEMKRNARIIPLD